MKTRKASSCIITNKKNEFLLQKKTIDYKDAPGKWVLFGGCMENNESPKETIERELKEELNISLNVKFVNKFNHVYRDLRTIENVFEAKIDKLIYFPTEGAGAAFFTKEEIEKLNTPPHIKRLIK